MKTVILFGLIFTLFSGVVLFVCGYSAKTKFDKLQDSLEAEGTVIELIESTDSENDTVYSPRVEFTTKADKKVVFTSSSYFSPSPYSAGDKIKLRYKLSKPEEAEINNFFSLWGGLILIGAIASVFFFIGIYVILIALKKV